ncbi:ATP-grasp domain-containing protein [Dehalobacterium formicoaceticum]|uniref:ATP-grasp domain-containing protein n=1 Tax=Dehalobacterium formicoaceticum TaxID=51515 RepID=A0ABT1Y6F0_9FIRM|nr:ATP-grasp domain-containing protein [Dehalobacterium formicoaceticum]MCR6545261.1 ATP-grasp domain-containing protein [Dehalobacterium formicoaceticum]
MNILLTAVGRRSYLVHYFKEVLGRNGQVHAANSNLDSIALQDADKAVITPLSFDDEYIPFLMEYCRKHHIRAIIPRLDIDLPILSKRKKEFESIGVKVIVSNEEVIAVCNDKWATYQFLLKHGFHTPRTFLSIQDALEAVKCHELSFPIMIKPRWGAGSLGIFEADNQEELYVLHQKTKKKIAENYIKVVSQQDPKRSVIIQEKLNGEEYGLDIINDLEGNFQSVSIKKKYEMRGGETDFAEIVEHKDLEETGQKISRDLGHISIIDVDAFLVEGVPFVLEMNPRFGGGYPFSHIGGVDLPKAIISWLKGEQVAVSSLQAKPGVIGIKDMTTVRLKSCQ